MRQRKTSKHHIKTLRDITALLVYQERKQEMST